MRNEKDASTPSLLIFACLAVLSLAKAEKLNSWNTIEEGDNYAVYGLGADKAMSGAMIYLETDSVNLDSAGSFEARIALKEEISARTLRAYFQIWSY